MGRSRPRQPPRKDTGGGAPSDRRPRARGWVSRQGGLDLAAVLLQLGDDFAVAAPGAVQLLELPGTERGPRAAAVLPVCGRSPRARLEPPEQLAQIRLRSRWPPSLGGTHRTSPAAIARGREWA